MTIQWDSVREETTALLQDLIRFDTTNPPGNETPCLEHVAAVLRRNGIESTLIESKPTRGNLVARLKGNGSKAPFMMMGHVDVVPVERDKWTVEPFGGIVKDGFVYGRGALDMKNIDVIQMMVLLLLHREKVPLARDVIFMLNADEEIGGKWGAQFMQEQHPDLITAAAGVTELGGNAFEFAGKRFFMVQTGEKAGSGFYLRAHGTPGHGSMPHDDNPVLKLVRALKRLGSVERPIHVSPTMRQYVETIARAAGPEGEIWYGLLDNATFVETLNALPVHASMKKMLHSQFHNSMAPTILSAGTKVNVIPSLAECHVDCRAVPGQTREDVRREVQAVVGDEIEIEFRSEIQSKGVEQVEATQSELWKLMDKHMQAAASDAVLLPFLHTVGTDGRFQVKLGTQIFGFTPALSPITEYDRIHGHDERVAISDLEFGVKVLYNVTKEFCGA
ncbi:MAG: M20/M25/M40 family metallo-hydrolase [Chloroflexi bacterium]|nr:M20/M25/M40 family metallo-hydrolase [Chloroflexota bacterium]